LNINTQTHLKQIRSYEKLYTSGLTVIPKAISENYYLHFVVAVHCIGGYVARVAIAGIGPKPGQPNGLRRFKPHLYCWYQWCRYLSMAGERERRRQLRFGYQWRQL
jgi:hypothetical protein